MTRQTRPRVMILMTPTHQMTVIIDVDDAEIRSIGKRTRSDMRNFNGKVTDDSI